MAGLGQRRRRARHRSRATTPEPHEECQRDDADNGQELNDTPTSLLAADILPFSFNRPYPLECRRVGRPSESLKGAHRTGRGTAPTRRREFIVSGVWVRNFTAGGSSGEVARAAREASGQIKLGRIDAGGESPRCQAPYDGGRIMVILGAVAASCPAPNGGE